jgi:radical SAM protein with 4Fe4S-binding SPASM domain
MDEGKQTGMKTEAQEVRQKSVTAKDILKLPYYFLNGVGYHAAGRIYTPKPVYATLHVTRQCNSRCVMCLDWRRQINDRELTITEIEGVFRNPLFNSLEKLALTGGEATLREDLVEIAQTILDSCPQIKEMSLTTNGFEPDLVMDRVNRLLKLANLRSLDRFVVSVSLDGCADIHERIRRLPRAFERVTETIKRLRRIQQKIPFHLRHTCVVQPLNLNHLVQLLEFADGLGLQMNFVPVWVYDSLTEDTSQAPLSFTPQQLAELRMLFEHQLKPRLALSTVIHWQEYFKIVSGRSRRLPCFLMHRNVCVDSDGTLYMCAGIDSSLSYGNVRGEPPDKIWYSKKAREIRKRVKNYYCPKCTIYCNTARSLREEFFYAAGFLLKEKGKKLFGK